MKNKQRKVNCGMIHKTVIKARYAETDQMGIIHHSVYPVWYETARTEFIKTSGITYSQLEKKGVMLPLSEIGCKYILPVHYEDEVVVETKITKITCAKIVFGYSVLLDGKVVNEGFSVHGFVSSDSFKPINIKKVLPDFYEKLKSVYED